MYESIAECLMTNRGKSQVWCEADALKWDERREQLHPPGQAGGYMYIHVYLPYVYDTKRLYRNRHFVTNEVVVGR